MAAERLLRSALRHLDRRDELPLVFRGVSPDQMEKLFEGVCRRRPDLQQIPLRCPDGPGVWHGLRTFFSADTGPGTFHDSWSAFIISVGIRGGGPGLELAAGLESCREKIAVFMAEPSAENGIQPLCRVLDAAARHLSVFLTAVDLESIDSLTLRVLEELTVRGNLKSPPLLAGLGKGSLPFRARILDPPKEERRFREPPRGLQPEVLGIAGAGAVLGLCFRPGEAAALSDGGKPELLLETGVCRLTGSGDYCFKSRDERMRYLDTIGSRRSTELHSRAAEIVLARKDPSPGSLGLAGDLLLRAGDEAGAGRAYLKAAESSDELHHRKAARLWAMAYAHHPEKTPEMLFRRSERLYMGGYIEEALEAAAEASRHMSFAPLLLMIEILHHNCEYPKARSLLEKAEALSLEPESDQALQLEILALKVMGMNLPLDQIEERVGLLSSRPLDPGQRCAVRLILARALVRYDRLDDAMRLNREVMELARESGLRRVWERALTALIACRRKAGLFEAAEEECLELQRSGARSGNLEALQYSLNTRGGIATSCARYEEAARCYMAVATLADRTGNRRLKSTALVNLGVTLMMRGRYEEAVDSLLAAVRMASQVGDTLKLAGAYGNLARIFLDMNRPEHAQDCVDTMLEAARQSGPAQMLESAVYLRARVLDARGEWKEALECLEEALAMARAAGKLRNTGMYLALKGQFQLHAGMVEEAAESFAVARDVCERVAKSINNADQALVGETACLVILGRKPPEALLELLPGVQRRTNTGTLFYWHWKTTGNPHSARSALDHLLPTPGESYAYRAHQMLEDLNGFLALDNPPEAGAAEEAGDYGD